MEISNLKNMVVLKNLPSNIVEEAIVIIKSNKKTKKLERIEKNKRIKQVEEKKPDYVLREAEMLISNYIAKLENNSKKEYKNKELKRNYVRLKKYAFISTFILLIQSLLLIIK